jgi:hypothetical protein
VLLLSVSPSLLTDWGVLLLSAVLPSLLLLLQAREDFDVRVMQLTKQRREGAMKAKTGRGGETRYEARLNSKKHRSTSRRRMKQDSVWGDDSDEELVGDDTQR